MDSGRVANRSKMLKGGAGILWEGGVNSGRVAYRCLKRGYILRGGGVDFGRASRRCLKWDILWDGRVNSGIRRHFEHIITKGGGGARS